MFAGQMKGGAIGPSDHNGFASFVGFNFVRLCWLIDMGKGEPVALLNIKNRVVAEDEGSAFSLRVRCRLVLFLAA